MGQVKVSWQIQRFEHSFSMAWQGSNSWHGLKQFRNGWADGPAYITQCPIQSGNSYSYDFNITGQRGTLWWHAHILWLRATVYGAIMIMPNQGVPFPFPQPHGETVLVLGEWWNSDVEEAVKQGNALGLPPNMSDAHTINGKPGPLFPCSEKQEKDERKKREKKLQAKKSMMKIDGSDKKKNKNSGGFQVGKRKVKTKLSALAKAKAAQAMEVDK